MCPWSNPVLCIYIRDLFGPRLLHCFVEGWLCQSKNHVFYCFLLKISQPRLSLILQYIIAAGWEKNYKSVNYIKGFIHTRLTKHTYLVKCSVYQNLERPSWELFKNTKCHLFKVLLGKKTKNARWQMLSAPSLANILNKCHTPEKPLSAKTPTSEVQSRKTNKKKLTWQ